MPKSNQRQASDRAKAFASVIWAEYPAMKPASEFRIQKHLAELDALFCVLNEQQIQAAINGLCRDKFRRDWVSSFERIAEELPRIRAVMAERKPKDSYLQRWKEEQNEKAQ